MTTKPMRLSVANGALLECPVYEQHQRGSNWAAVIDVDGTAPGGLSRRWLPRGKGECFYLIEQLSLFDAVEFAGDYTTFAGNKRPARYYGVVVSKTDDYVLLEECKSGAAAVLLAKKKRESGEARKAALLDERQNLINRACKLDEEIEALKKDDSGCHEGPYGPEPHTESCDCAPEPIETPIDPVPAVEA